MNKENFAQEGTRTWKKKQHNLSVKEGLGKRWFVETTQRWGWDGVGRGGGHVKFPGQRGGCQEKKKKKKKCGKRGCPTPPKKGQKKSKTESGPRTKKKKNGQEL